MTTSLNDWQRAVANAYCGGEYATVETVAQCQDLGDPLFTFLINELEDVEDRKEAIRLLATAINQIGEVLNAVEHHLKGAYRLVVTRGGFHWLSAWAMHPDDSAAERWAAAYWNDNCAHRSDLILKLCSPDYRLITTICGDAEDED